jgi:ABC-type sugar transport system ATPase subunit
MTMGDRVAVMKNGRIQQCALPQAAATLAGGHLDQLLGPPTGPTSKKATKQGPQTAMSEPETPPD